MRTNENYTEHLILSEPSSTWVSELSVLTELKTTFTIDLLTVDVMYDILEGIWEYDLGLLLHRFIAIDKFFACNNINTRINELHYGDEDRNNLREIIMNHVQNKFIKMSVSEAHTCIKNIGVLLGKFISFDNEHWKLIIYLTEILQIVTSRVVAEGLSDYLGSVINGYLFLRNKLFPESLKPKHHILVHYPRIMNRMDPL